MRKDYALLNLTTDFCVVADSSNKIQFINDPLHDFIKQHPDEINLHQIEAIISFYEDFGTASVKNTLSSKKNSLDCCKVEALNLNLKHEKVFKFTPCKSHHGNTISDSNGNGSLVNNNEGLENLQQALIEVEKLSRIACVYWNPETNDFKHDIMLNSILCIDKSASIDSLNSFSKLLSSDNQICFKNALSSAFSTGNGSCDFEFVATNAMRIYLTIKAKYNPEIDSNVLIIIHDISDRMEINYQLQTQKRELRFHKQLLNIANMTTSESDFLSKVLPICSDYFSSSISIIYKLCHDTQSITLHREHCSNNVMSYLLSRNQSLSHSIQPNSTLYNIQMRASAIDRIITSDDLKEIEEVYCSMVTTKDNDSENLIVKIGTQALIFIPYESQNSSRYVLVFNISRPIDYGVNASIQKLKHEIQHYINEREYKSARLKIFKLNRFRLSIKDLIINSHSFDEFSKHFIDELSNWSSGIEDSGVIIRTNNAKEQYTLIYSKQRKSRLVPNDIRDIASIDSDYSVGESINYPDNHWVKSFVINIDCKAFIVFPFFVNGRLERLFYIVCPDKNQINVIPDEIKPHIAHLFTIGCKSFMFLDKIAFNEQRFKAIIEKSNEIVTIIDEHGIIKYASDSTSSLLGYQIEQINNKNVFSFIHPDDRAAALNRFKKIIKNNQAKQYRVYRLLNSRGEFGYYRVIISDQRENEFIQGFVINAHNIDEVIEAEKALEKAQIESSRHQSRLLSSQLNPHFIFNALNSIQYFILHENIDDSIVYLSNFSKLVRQVLEFSTKDGITIEQELNFLENYLTIEKQRCGNALSYNFYVDQCLKNDDNFIPPMLIQPLVENALQHGLAPFKYDGNITINIGLKDNILMISVKDNGVGINAGKKLAQDRTGGKYKSYSSEINALRLDLLRRSQHKNISYSVSENNPDSNDGRIGTVARILIPAN